MFKTKKEARAAGLRPADAWLRWDRGSGEEKRSLMFPRKGAVPCVVKGEEFFRIEDCEEVVSATEASRRGLSARRADSIGTCHGQHGSYEVYRLSDCVPKKKGIPPKAIDVLRAVFTVNRAAKRYRDIGPKHYQGSRHGLARHSRTEKDRLYTLKDAGIILSYQQGRLAFEGRHGGLALYRGEGYCFHSCLVPSDAAEAAANTLDADHFFKESAPKEASEARLKDAVFTLENLTICEDAFVRLERPEHPKKRRARERDSEYGGRIGRWSEDEDDAEDWGFDDDEDRDNW